MKNSRIFKNSSSKLQPSHCSHRVLTVEEVEALLKQVEDERQVAESEEAGKKK